MYFKHYETKEIFIIPILKDNKKHYINNNKFLFFVGFDITNCKYIITKTIKANKIWTLYSKHFQLLTKNIDSQLVNDFSLIYYLYTQLKLKIDLPIWYNKTTDNETIPETIHIKYLQNVISIFNKYKDLKLPDGYNFYYNNLKYLHELDKTKIKLDIKYSGLKDNYIYSNYFNYTQTGRPTNTFNNLNLLSLSKKDNKRKMIIPNNDLLVEFDFSGYHLSILNNLLKLNINGNIHEYIGKQFFGVDKLTTKQYKDIKLLDFKYMYDEVPLSVKKKIKFFEIVENFASRLYEFANKYNFIYTHIGRRKLNIAKNYKTQLNYFLQSYEIENGLTLLKPIIKLLDCKSTKVLLYTYDSLLFDVKQSEISLLNDIKTILQQNNKFKVTIKSGTNYKELTDYEHS